jgi:hypothetical protein
MIFEAPNSRRFDNWRHDPHDFMRPRVFNWNLSG